jgi:hypothetical protein
MKTKKKIVEKGSYEKGKVETYPSKKAMVKHEKKETKPFEKGESKKPSPMKQTTVTKGQVKIAPKPIKGLPTPPTKMKKC